MPTAAQSRPVLSLNLTATINAATASGEVDLMGTTLVGLRVPASMAGTSLTFSVAEAEGGTFVLLHDRYNVAIGVTIDTNARQFAIDPVLFAGVRWLKINSSATETAKTITLVTRPV